MTWIVQATSWFSPVLSRFQALGSSEAMGLKCSWESITPVAARWYTHFEAISDADHCSLETFLPTISCVKVASGMCPAMSISPCSYLLDIPKLLTPCYVTDFRCVLIRRAWRLIPDTRLQDIVFDFWVRRDNCRVNLVYFKSTLTAWWLFCIIPIWATILFIIFFFK